MKVRVIYRSGLVLDFVVNEDILIVDFVELAKEHGDIRMMEFPE